MLEQQALNFLLEESGESGESDEFGSNIYYSDRSGKSEYTRHHSIIKPIEKTILPDLETLGLGEDIKLEAERIFQEMEKKTKKGKRRGKILFFCIFKAHISLGRPRDPGWVANLVGIPSTDINKSFSICSDGSPTCSPNVFHSPIQFLSQYANLIGLDRRCHDDLREFGDRIIKSDSDILDGYPQVVAAGIIIYYMATRGVTVNRKDFSKMVGKSEMTISKMVRRVAEIDNS